MFVIDEKPVNKICKRVEKYPELPRDMEFKFAKISIDGDQVTIKLNHLELKDYKGQVVIRGKEVKFTDLVFDCLPILQYIDKEQTKLINEFKKPLEYKINKLYKLIYRRIISKNLYWKDTPLITSCNKSISFNGQRDMDTYTHYIYNLHIKHPINESELGCVTWEFESGNHFGKYHHDAAIEKNINYILELLQEDQCS